MPSDLEFLVGILELGDKALVAKEDFDGPRGDILRVWQQLGLLDREPSMNPIPTCPHCGDGEPHRFGARLLCGSCMSTVDERHLLVWRIRLEPLLERISGDWKLRGGIRHVDHDLWQLGTGDKRGSPCECFFWRNGFLSRDGARLLSRYRSLLLLYCLSKPPAIDGVQLPAVSLLEVFRLESRSFSIVPWHTVFQAQGAVRFDAHSGALWAGDSLLGEVPVGSKEFSFLQCLASQLDHFVPYPAIKRYVLVHAGSTDETEEATFCQGLKSRIKKRWIREIDHLIVTTNKAEGYRLRGFLKSSLCGPTTSVAARCLRR